MRDRAPSLLMGPGFPPVVVGIVAAVALIAAETVVVCPLRPGRAGDLVEGGAPPGRIGGLVGVRDGSRSGDRGAQHRRGLACSSSPALDFAERVVASVQALLCAAREREGWG
jgi:hypothetical protein